MDDNDDALGSAFGLGAVLAEVGVDSASLNAFLERTEGAGARDMAAAVDTDEGKFMDDVSEASLPDESADDKAARIREQAAIKAEEERWARRAAAELAGTAAGPSAEAKKKRRQREEGEKDLIKRAWPDYAPGTMLKMSEIFYETPGDLLSLNATLLGKKRRLLSGLPHEECGCSSFVVVNMLTQSVAIAVDIAKAPSPTLSFLLPNLPPLPAIDPRQPNYLNPIGEFFDPEWIKDSRERRRVEMTKPPKSVRFDASAESSKMLDLADWESDIVLCSM